MAGGRSISSEYDKIERLLVCGAQTAVPPPLLGHTPAGLRSGRIERYGAQRSHKKPNFLVSASQTSFLTLALCSKLQSRCRHAAVCPSKRRAQKQGLFSRVPQKSWFEKKWIAAIRRDEGKEFRISKHTKVCSKHNYATGTRRLKNDAVPSIFSFAHKQSKVQRKPSKKRCVHNVAVNGEVTTASGMQTDDICDELSGTPHVPTACLDAEMDFSSLKLQPPQCTRDCRGQKEAQDLRQSLTTVKNELKVTEEQLRQAHVELQRAKQEAKEKEEEIKSVKELLFRTSRELELTKATAEKLEKKVGREFSIDRFKHSDEILYRSAIIWNV
ncbi:uncharacterized protein LOC144119669 [Amblyomma americanum]